MAALQPQFAAVLEGVLSERFVRHLPTVLANGTAAKQLSRAFSAFALNKLLGVSPSEAASAVVDDINDNGLDAIYFHEKTKTLYLLQTKLKAGNFELSEAHAFCDGVRLLLKREFAQFNAHVQNRQGEIEQALCDTCDHIQLLIPYTGEGVSVSAQRALDTYLQGDGMEEDRLSRQVQYFSATDVTAALLAEQAHAPVDADLWLKNLQKVEGPKTIYYGMSRLSDLVSLHLAHGKSLYEQNIRYFLGSQKSDVNKAIKKTLLDKPSEFFYLNNGVTAIGQKVASKTAREPGFKKLQVQGLSIINGAQTVASSAEFLEQFPGKNIETAWVMLTLIQADADAHFSTQVTKARNNQNNVDSAHFVSLDPIQERLRCELATVGVEYQYRPEASPVDGETLVIRLEEAVRALAVMSEDPRYLAWLKSEPDTLRDVSSQRYKTLFHDTLSGLHLANVSICNNAIRETMNDVAASAPPGSQDRLVYREGLHVVCAVLLKRLRQQIQAGQLLDKVNVQTLISRPLDELRQQTLELALSQLDLENFLKSFRNQNQVLPFMMNLMERHYGLSDDPAIAPLRNITVSEKDDIYPQQQLNKYLIQRAPQL